LLNAKTSAGRRSIARALPITESSSASGRLDCVDQAGRMRCCSIQRRRREHKLAERRSGRVPHDP